MTTIEELKAIAQSAIDRRSKWLITAAETILRTPEIGFREVETSRYVSERLSELGVQHEAGIAFTGIKGFLNGKQAGPCVAVICELDSLKGPGHPNADPRTGAAHACGHNCQVATMLGAAVGLMASAVLEELSGRVALMAVPAEEFIDVEYRWDLHREGKLGLMSGKQEMVRLGAFDDVDMAMMAHPSSSPEDRSFSVGGTSTGHLVKYVRFIGKAAHAGGSPHRGVNALQAALVALNAINAQRETLRDDDAVRLHGILTAGGDAANSTPADVRYEGRVRGRTPEAVADANMKADRSLRAGAMAMGAQVNIVTIPGYLPMINDETMMGVIRENAVSMVGDRNSVMYPNSRTRGGSTDMGDLSQIIPAVHPYAGGTVGNGHGVDYLVDDYEKAVVNPAKLMAMAVIDLLSNDAARAKEVIAESRPPMTKKQYLKLQESRLTEELYDGKDS